MSISERIAATIMRHLGKLTLLVLALVLALGLGLQGLRFSSDNSSFFGSDNQESRDLAALSQHYATSSGFLIMVRPPEGEMFTPATLQTLREMEADLWQIPFTLRVETPLNVPHSRSEDGALVVGPLLDPQTEITPEVARRVGNALAGSDLLRNRLVGEDLQAYGLALNVVLGAEFEARRDAVLAALTDTRQRWEARYPGTEIRVTGAVLGGLTLAQAARQDIVTLVPVAFVLVIALLLYFLRSVRAVATSAAVVLAATVATFGFTGLLGIELTAATAVGPLAVMVLTAASCIHVILGWLRGCETAPPDIAARNALADNLAPVLVTTVTTSIGFLGLNFAEAPPLRELGTIVGFGLGIGMLATFTLLPLGLRGSARAAHHRLPLSGPRMQRLADLSLRHRRRWLGAFALLAGVAVLGLFRLGYDDSLVRYFDQRFEFRRDTDAIQRHLTGLDSLQFSFTAPEGGSVYDPAFLRDIDAFVGWIEGQEHVVGVSSLTGTLKALHLGVNDRDPAFDRLPDSRAANAQLMMLYEMSLPEGFDLGTSVDPAQRHTRVVVQMRSDHSRQLRELGQRAEAWMAANTPATTARPTGVSYSFATVSQRNNAQMLTGLVLVLALVSAIMMVTLRDLRLGLISLAPNLMPALLAFGIWGLTFRDVNLGSTVVTTMTFGIVVDDTVHFLMHYQRGRARGLTALAALRDTFRVVGAAIIVTSVCLAAGFSAMATSGFAINQHLGALTAIVIVFALLADLLFLPALLLKFDRT